MKYLQHAFIAIFLASFPCLTFAKDVKPGQAPHITQDTKLAIVRLLSSEFVWTRKPLPLGDKGIVIKPNGELLPNDAALKMEVESRGEAAKAGQRVQITNVAFKGNDIVLEINGGAKRKTKWYEHIQVGIGDNTAQAPQNQPVPKGTYLAIQF